MSKSHKIHLNIINNTPFDFQYNDDYFQTGRLADDNHWPQTISAGHTAQIECYESDWSPVGCSGWVKYLAQGKELFFCFSNPVSGSNGIAFGLTNKAWDSMSGKYDNGITVPLSINGSNLWFNGHISSTGGDDNQARWDVTYIDLNQVSLANIELLDALDTFNNISTQGTRQYYECSDAPTYISGLALSHFKGLSAFGEKLIFSHTNLDPVAKPDNGRYLVADRITVSDQGITELAANTDHTSWVHPCSSQACGSFMALGIQATADNPSHTSEIEIYDIRPTQINQPIKLLGSIKQSNTGVNGVGMTRTQDGHYLVAAIDGQNLRIYRSDTTDLLGAFPNFTLVYNPDGKPAFPESGPGVALVTQKNGEIYLFTLNAEDNGDNPRMGLFKVDLTNQKIITVVAKKSMPLPGMSGSVTDLEKAIAAILLMPPPYDLMGVTLEVLLKTLGETYLNSSFRWGKGLKIMDEHNVEVYASDRNVLPLSRIPLIPPFASNRDFSLVTWKSNINSWPANGLTVAFKTGNWKNFLTIVNGGGLGGDKAALATDRRVVGPWEKFNVRILDREHGTFALQTCNGNYITAVQGGGIGGPNDASCPVHTDKTQISGEEVIIFELQSDGTFALRTPSGYYITAVGGGGRAMDTTPISTDRTVIGPWETFWLTAIPQ